MITRALEEKEYKKIIQLILNGFVIEGKKRVEPNAQVAIALQLQANLGLRIGDVLQLKPCNFKNGKLETIEEKTGKLQYRTVNKNVYSFIKEYISTKKLNADDNLFSVKVKNVQKILRKVTAFLNLENISTHSFRKMYATKIYEESNFNLELVKKALNHADLTSTQKYINVNQQAVNEVCGRINYLII